MKKLVAASLALALTAPAVALADRADTIRDHRTDRGDRFERDRRDRDDRFDAPSFAPNILSTKQLEGRRGTVMMRVPEGDFDTLQLAVTHGTARVLKVTAHFERGRRAVFRPDAGGNLVIDVPEHRDIALLKIEYASARHGRGSNPYLQLIGSTDGIYY